MHHFDKLHTLVGMTPRDDAKLEAGRPAAADAAPPDVESRRPWLRDPVAPASTTPRGAVRVPVVLGHAVLLVVVLWWLDAPDLSTSPGALVMGIAQLAGLLAALLVCAQLLLIARIPWFERRLGLDRLTSWHIALGTPVALLIVLHIAGTIVADALVTSAAAWDAIVSVLTSYPDMLPTLVGTALFAIVVVSSLAAVRRHLR